MSENILRDLFPRVKPERVKKLQGSELFQAHEAISDFSKLLTVLARSGQDVSGLEQLYDKFRMPSMKALQSLIITQEGFTSDEIAAAMTARDKNIKI